MVIIEITASALVASPYIFVCPGARPKVYVVCQWKTQSPAHILAFQCLKEQCLLQGSDKIYVLVPRQSKTRNVNCSKLRPCLGRPYVTFKITIKIKPFKIVPLHITTCRLQSRSVSVTLLVLWHPFKFVLNSMVYHNHNYSQH